MSLWDTSYRLAKRVIGRLPPWALRVCPCDVYEVALEPWRNEANPAPPAAGPANRIAWVANREELESLGPLAADANKALWNGETFRAVAAWRDGQPVACGWAAHGSYEDPELRLRFEVADDEVWLVGGSVSGDYRGRGVYRQMVKFAFADLAAAGKRRALMGIVRGNRASRRIHQHLGARPIGHVAAARILGVTIAAPTGAARRRGSPISLRSATVRIS